MVWIVIMVHGRTSFHVSQRGTVIGVRYKNAVLKLSSRIFRGVVGHDLILAEDIAWPYGGHHVNDFLDSEDIHRIDWSARFPDLNL